MEKDICLYKHSQKDCMMSRYLQINLLLLELNENPDGELSYFSFIFFLLCNYYVVEVSLTSTVRRGVAHFLVKSCRS